jgi:predicted nucleotidyltransferase
MMPDQTLLDKLVQRVVESVQPLRIVLFGSAVRGQMGPDSDLDLLVVMQDACDCRAVARQLYSRLSDLGCAKDLVVVRQSDVEQLGANPFLVIHTALTEGRELYRAAS